MASAKKVLRFPDPGPAPRFGEPRDELERRRMQDELHDFEMRRLIHRAVHTNDPRLRAILASQLARDLHKGWRITPESREWLAWVLTRLVDAHRVPHLARGRVIATGQKVILIRRLIEELEGLRAGRVTERLREAASNLGVSYETVRGIYYSQSYRAWKIIIAGSKKVPAHYSE